MLPYLSIIIPTYNEAERLPETLVALKKFILAQKYEIEVVVVDDGSSDATVTFVKSQLADFPQMRLIANAQNQGKGRVVRDGMLAAKGEYRLFMDADNSTPPSQIPKLLKWVPEYEVVIGSRYLDANSIKVKQDWKRRVLSRLSNWLIQQLVLPGIVDTQCGFKLFSAAASKRIFPRQSMSGWSFDFELLTITRQLKYDIKEVPVDWYDAKRSQLRAFRAYPQALRDLLIIWRRRRQGNL